MPDRSTILIVGANLAGGRAAEALRQQGFAGRIVLVGAEPDRPYERPPLSKGILLGTRETESVFIQTVDYYAQNDIELRLGVRATQLDPAGRSVSFDDGESVNYDKLLIATGSELRRITVPGSDLAGVRYLRTIKDARALGRDIAAGGRVVVVGAGFIGLEVAASARTAGCDVTVIDPSKVPLARALGPDMGQVVADIHRDHGVNLRLETGVGEFRGSGRVEEVVTTAGDRIPCDVVAVGVGVTPSTGWLSDSRIAMDNGILVDEFARTSLPDVFAAGDVANSWNPLMGARVRLEHYDNAQNQGIAAAASMLGGTEPYAPVPSFWTDQYEFTLQYIGHASGNDELLMRGDTATRSFTAFYMREGVIRAVLSTRPRDVTAARRLVRNQKRIDPSVLTDEQVDLRAISR